MFGRKSTDTITIRGTKNSTLRKGQEIVVSADDKYWLLQVGAGNAEIISGQEEEGAVEWVENDQFDDFLEEIERTDEEDGEE